MNHDARLILEASTGAHGPVAKRLADLLAEVSEDAALFRLLRDLPCNSLYLTKNEHAGDYRTAAEWIDLNPYDFSGDDPAEIERMKQTNTIWRLQIYPRTPVGFEMWHCATLAAAINAAREDA